MRAERDTQARMVLEIVVQRDTFAQRFISVARSWDREVQHRNRYLCPNSMLMNELADHVREEIHIGKAGDAALELLRDRKLASGLYERFVYPSAFRWPNVLAQPRHQGQVVSQSAKQSHGSVPVRIDKSRSQKHSGEVPSFPGDVLDSLLTRGYEYDAPVTDAQCMVLQNNTGRLNRDEPGRKQ